MVAESWGSMAQRPATWDPSLAAILQPREAMENLLLALVQWQQPVS
jgi:hypothetical protein